MQISHSFWNVCQQYFAEGIALPIFVIAIVWLFKKWNKEKRIAFLTILCASVLFVYNEVSYKIFEMIGEGSTYYRLFWICPITLIVSYFIIELVWNVEKTKRVWLVLAIGVTGYMLSTGQLSNWTKIPDNIYQLDNDVIQVADALMEQTGGEMTTLIDDGTLYATIRQYNSKIEFTELYTHQINQLLYTNSAEYLGRYVQDYISLNESEYIAIEKEKMATVKVLESGGLRRVAETDGYYLYHANHEKIDDDWMMLEEMDKGICNRSNIEYIPVDGMQGECRYVYLSDFGTIDNEEVYKEIIEEINALEIEGVFINAMSSNNREWVSKYEHLLAELKVPYYSNDKALQLVESEEVIVCMIDNTSEISEETIQGFVNLKNEGKPVIMVLSSKLGASEELYKEIVAEDSPVVQVLTVEKDKNEKMLINNSILQYAIAVDKGQMITVISISGQEE